LRPEIVDFAALNEWSDGTGALLAHTSLARSRSKSWEALRGTNIALHFAPRAEQIRKGAEYFQSERERQRTVRQRISALQKANEKHP
jgi:hypothetical protein